MAGISFSKRLNQKKTNRLAEPVRSVTKLDVDQVLQFLRRIVDETPAKTGLLQSGHKLWLFGQEPGPWKVCYGSPSKKEPGKVVQSWLTHVGLQASSAGTETMVTVNLAEWKTSEGKLVFRKEFEQFQADFARLISSSDPTYRSLEAS
jgi:hypothetical protein